MNGPAVRPDLAGSAARGWKRGWQPADVVHVLRRVIKADTLMLTMAADSMAAHLATFAPTTVDERFTSQLTELRAEATSWNTLEFINRWTRRTGVTASAVVRTVVVLAETLARLPSVAVLCPPPGTPCARGPRPSRVDPKLLERVRALLAKAESSDYDAEAESLTAKAQELMARYSIDHALLATTGPTPEDPTGIRIAVDNPYESEKAMLLDRVARANRCQAIRSSHLGFVTVLGFEADLRAIEVLYTSLLVQVAQALQREGSRPTKGGGNRTVSFRRSFQQAFAVRSASAGAARPVTANQATRRAPRRGRTTPALDITSDAHNLTPQPAILDRRTHQGLAPASDTASASHATRNT